MTWDAREMREKERRAKEVEKERERRERRKELDEERERWESERKNEEKDEEILAVIILIIISYRYYVRKRVSFFFFSPLLLPLSFFFSFSPISSSAQTKEERSPREKKEIERREEKDFWTSESWKVEYQWRVIMWLKEREEERKRRIKKEEKKKDGKFWRPTNQHHKCHSCFLFMRGRPSSQQEREREKMGEKENGGERKRRCSFTLSTIEQFTIIMIFRLKNNNFTLKLFLSFFSLPLADSLTFLRERERYIWKSLRENENRKLSRKSCLRNFNSRVILDHNLLLFTKGRCWRPTKDTLNIFSSSFSFFFQFLIFYCEFSTLLQFFSLFKSSLFESSLHLLPLIPKDGRENYSQKKLRTQTGTGNKLFLSHILHFSHPFGFERFEGKKEERKKGERKRERKKGWREENKVNE